MKDSGLLATDSWAVDGVLLQCWSCGTTWRHEKWTTTTSSRKSEATWQWFRVMCRGPVDPRPSYSFNVAPRSISWHSPPVRRRL